MTSTTSAAPLNPPPGVPPWLVALFRGLLEAVVLAVLGVLAVAALELDGELATYGPVLVLVVRSLEGLADQKIDPTRQRSKLGGAPVVPSTSSTTSSTSSPA